MNLDKPIPHKGRGANSNADGRYEPHTHTPYDDGWGSLEAELPALRTTVSIDSARSIISYNRSPDIPFDRSINPYRGCEHGCVYCYARPTHAYLGLSPGLDFESRLFVKSDAAALLTEELRHPNYRCRPIALGANTDPYQPVEREWAGHARDFAGIGRLPTPGHYRHQSGVGGTRYRHSHTHGRRGFGASVHFRHHTRS